ncbi:MAG: PaaI family thioesterase [Proteobacteria bacterium]|nr:PaaI family thioesterase [Pseudomonadota bacterium]
MTTENGLDPKVGFNSPFTALLGMEVKSCVDGRSEIELPVRKELTQYHGFAHGVVVGGLVDIVCAWAASSVAGRVVTTEYKVNFLAPAVGERLIGRGQVVKATRRQIVCRGDVYAVQDGREKLAATGLATLMTVE